MKCRHRTPDGARCTGEAVPPTASCVDHLPAVLARRAAWAERERRKITRALDQLLEE